jgi:DNA-binding response OmpR family regulator
MASSLTSVPDADSGVRLAGNGEHQIVILDVMLPGGDGRKVLRRIRLGSAVPVIMLTARRDEADRIAGLEGGADDYLPKPFKPRELVARLRGVAAQRNGGSPRYFQDWRSGISQQIAKSSAKRR